ncbi:hypothetical protein BKA70DRAFT_1238700 [Coprinopsis sp. MPI-PUGE-AT-0042]|nr:hypothetical protein BKA70DRAFT_1238700 [Coprinopsis sp. MPI-PUGE-AT-0042]
MPKESVASSTRNPQSLRLAPGTTSSEGEPEAATTRALALDISSYSDGRETNAPKVDGPSRQAWRKEEGVGSVGGRSDSGTLVEPSDSALVVMNASIERQQIASCD